MVTHNLDIVGETDRIVRLVHGRVEQPQPAGMQAAGLE
jgi:ABC-type lipoprotein export system ATPase subunit